MSEKAEHISQLDGLRGLAALAVCCYSYFSLTNSADQPGQVFGLIGAQLFYTLSGFLIARNLILNASGRFIVDLKSFYARRLLRIAPIYYLVLVGIHMASTLPQPVLFYTFFANAVAALSDQQQALFNNLATISTEMQFYAVVPFLLVAMPAKYRVPLLVLLLFILNLGQFVCQIFFQICTPLTILESGQYLLWGSIAGCLGLHWNKLKELNGTILFLFGVTINSVWLVMVLSDQFNPIHWNSILTLVRGLGTSVLVLGLWQTTNELLTVTFSNLASVSLGRISYGFFLFHTLALVYTRGLSLEYRIALSLILGLTLAMLSWRYVELPLSRLKRQVFPVPTDEAPVPSLDLSLVKSETVDDGRKTASDRSIAGLLESSLYDWLRVAKNAHDAGNLEEARTYYLRAIELFTDAEPIQSIQIDCLRYLIEICGKLNRDEEALVIARKCVKVSMNAGDLQYATSLLDLAQCLHALGCQDEAKIVLLDALRVSNISQGRPLTAKASRVFNDLFPPASEGEIQVEIEKTLNRGSRTRQERFAPTVAILAAITMCFVTFGVQNQRTPLITTSNLSPGGEYTSIDGLKCIRFSQSTAASLWDHGKIFAAKYETLGMIPLDFIRAIPGLIRKNALFFTVGNDVIVGDDGSVLYKSDAPEIRLYQAMLKISYFSNWYYSKYNHYPDNGTDWLKERDIWYENPFTQSKQYAAFSDFDPKGEPPHSQAGMIRCRSIGKDVFLVTGYGRSGHRLIGGEGNQFFSFELKGGKNLTEEYAHRFDGDITSPRQASERLSIYLVDSFQVRNLLSALRALPQLVLPIWFASLATSMILLRLFRREHGRFFVLSAMVIPTVLVLLVMIMSIGD